MISPSDKNATTGEQGKAIGMTAGARSKADRIATGTLAMLNSLLDAPDGCATIDDATADLAEKFNDGGKWRGSVTRSLASRRIIERVGYVESDRPSRHRGIVSQWKLRDRGEAILLRNRLRADDKNRPPAPLDVQKRFW